MADVWKSQPKKFCEICKCWFADNQISIRHHENGSRHKAMVREKLRDLGRKNREQDKERRDLGHTLRQMEFAALQSYKRDAKDSPELANAYNIHQNVMGLPIRPAPKVVPRPAVPQNMFPQASEPDITGNTSSDYRVQLDPNSAAYVAIPPPDSSFGGVAPPKVWAESKSPEGYSYYWHTVTGETRWEPPPEGYMTVEEQEDLIRAEQAATVPQPQQSAMSGVQEVSQEPETVDLASPEAEKSETFEEIMVAVRESRKAQQKLAANSGGRNEAQAAGFTSAASGYAVGAIPLPKDPPPPPPTDVLTELTQTTEDRMMAKAEMTKAGRLIAEKLAEAKERERPMPETEEKEATKSTAADSERNFPKKRRANPYGEWTPVETKAVEESEEKIDWGLPKSVFTVSSESAVLPEISLVPEEDEGRSKMKFTEKTVASLKNKKMVGVAGSKNQPTVFKKRKLGTGARNLRNKDDEVD